MKKAKASIPQMVELYLQGLEPDEIKEELGYSSAEYITQKLRDAKVYDSSRKRIDKGKIKALRKAGWSIQDIAEEEQLPESIIREVLNETLR